ncbi:MAG: hypothetical protein ABSA71_10600 [Desulfomonilia bacterium]
MYPYIAVDERKRRCSIMPVSHWQRWGHLSPMSASHGHVDRWGVAGCAERCSPSGDEGWG